jgi:acyl carrier protein
MLGHAVGPDEPLMASGLDSRTAMELRAALADELGISLPVTLLYDAQVGRSRALEQRHLNSNWAAVCVF